MAAVQKLFRPSARFRSRENDRMKDHAKTQQILIGELASLRERIAELERSALEQKRVEEALRESAEKYRLLFEYSPWAIFILTKRASLSRAMIILLILSGLPEKS